MKGFQLLEEKYFTVQKRKVLVSLVSNYVSVSWSYFQSWYRPADTVLFQFKKTRFWARQSISLPILLHRRSSCYAIYDIINFPKELDIRYLSTNILFILLFFFRVIFNFVIWYNTWYIFLWHKIYYLQKIQKLHIRPG